MDRPTMSLEEAIERVTDLARYRAPLRVEVFRLFDGSLEARLTVDPDVAFAAIQAVQAEVE